MDMTVVIPTYNGGDRVSRLLEHLSYQTLAPSTWKVLVVDNASTDGTVQTIRHSHGAQLLSRRGVDFEVITEADPGANNARLRGLAAASTEFVCFLDDDVEPDADLLEKSVPIFKDSQIGAVLPQISPIFDASPPASVLRRQHLLAINTRFLGTKRARWASGSPSFAPVVTAALVVRRAALQLAIEARGRARLLPGRLRNSLACGEDIELGILLNRGGFDCVYEPALHASHQISSRRFRLPYFVRLIVGVVRSQLTIDRIYRPQRRATQLAARLRAILALFMALAASPLLLFRRDGPRELVFVLAARLARVMGAYPDLLRRANARTSGSRP